MPLYEPIIPARYAAPLLDILGAIPDELLQPVLAATGVDGASLRNADRSITFAQFDALFVAMVSFSGRTDLGFELGHRIRIEDHQALGIVLRRSGTIDQLLRVLTRFSRLITPSIAMQYRRTANGGELLWRPAAYMSATTLRALEEIFAVSMHVEVRDMLYPVPASFDVYLSMEAPPHAARYKKLYPTRYHFATRSLPEVKFVFPADLLDRAIRSTGTETDSNARGVLVEQQRSIGVTTRWSEWVDLILREAEGCQPTRDELAELLNVSRATLTRRLAAEGNTFRDLANASRYRRACEMLVTTDQAISQIGYRLGYEDAANFTHAFGLISGLSPSAWRAANTRRVCAPGGDA